LSSLLAAIAIIDLLQWHRRGTDRPSLYGHGTVSRRRRRYRAALDFHGIGVVMFIIADASISSAPHSRTLAIVHHDGCYSGRLLNVVIIICIRFIDW
jgi:hypothetical protein